MTTRSTELVALPKYIAFKGDNGKYLSLCWTEGHPYLIFCGTDICAESVAQEVFPNSDGSIRIKSLYTGKFWRRSPNWIWADQDDFRMGLGRTSYDQDTVFWPIKVGNNAVVLKNNGNNNFCKRLSKEWKEDCLNADVGNYDKYSVLVIEELVKSRTISDVDFRVKEAKINQKETIQEGSERVTNSSERPTTEHISFSYTQTKSATWSNSISLTLGVTTTLQTRVPYIFEGKIEISASVSGTHQWGETTENSKTVTYGHEVTVSPKSVAFITMMVTKGSYEIPFSYKQTDQYFDGSIKTYYKNDGIYKGNSTIDVDFKNTEKKL